MLETSPEDAPPISELSRKQRRVLGVLIEKGLTTPDAYPLTLKALTTGCNQKSNRDPTTNYSEDDVAETLEQLRELGLVGELHTDSGRTPRYRHYVRHKFTFTEPQLAIIGELLLRGKQRLGELRARASRMVAIDSLELLRDELQGLEQMKLLQSSGNLERRGTFVDHNLYRANEGMRLEQTPDDSDDPPLPATRPTRPVTDSAAAPTSVAASQELTARLNALETSLETLRNENRELREELATLRDAFRDLSDSFGQLRQDLGG